MWSGGWELELERRLEGWAGPTLLMHGEPGAENPIFICGPLNCNRPPLIRRVARRSFASCGRDGSWREGEGRGRTSLGLQPGDAYGERDWVMLHRSSAFLFFLT